MSESRTNDVRAASTAPRAARALSLDSIEHAVTTSKSDAGVQPTVIARGARDQTFAFGEPCDMRKGINTLAGLDVTTGDTYLFVGKDRKRAKCVWFDGVCAHAGEPHRRWPLRLARER